MGAEISLFLSSSHHFFFPFSGCVLVFSLSPGIFFGPKLAWPWPKKSRGQSRSHPVGDVGHGVLRLEGQAAHMVVGLGFFSRSLCSLARWFLVSRGKPFSHHREATLASSLL